MITEINHLLNHTRTLLSYEERLREASGAHFNVFEILRISSYEVTTHSPILAELLNPRGRHGLGARFLNIFAEQLNLRISAEAQVLQEHWIGTKGGEQGGRIDILIRDNDTVVIIENKIYANDQEKQITRYLTSHPQALVLYLTLYGNRPRDEIGPNNEGRFRCISYKENIVKWLEACKKESTAAPFVRETIAQYINLIKTLTGQNTNARMTDEISKAIISVPGNLDAYLTLIRSRGRIAAEIGSILKGQLDSIASEFGLYLDFDSEFGGKDKGFYLQNEWMKERELNIGFAFDGKNHWGLYYGFRFPKPNHPLHQRLKEAFDQNVQPSKSTDWWPAWVYWDGRGDWWAENDTTFRDILSGTFKNELKQKVQKLSNIVDSVKA